MSIFSRLMTGYLALLVLATGVSVYAIIQLRHVRNVTQSVILVDNPLLELQKHLSDALLSEQRYEKKFLIMQDDILYRGFLASKDEFEGHLRNARPLAGSSGLRTALARAEDLHKNYLSLFLEETGHVRSGREYSTAWYSDEKERTLAALSEEIMKVRSMGQQGMFDKVRLLSEAGTRATRAAMVTTGTAVAVGVLLSFVITAGITRPLSRMKTKMAEISSGVHEIDLNITSPPEIAALSRTFNFMCGRLKELDALESDFYARMSHELRTPLTSLRESANLFLEGRGGPMTEQQKKLLTIIAEESERLIRFVNSLLPFSKLEAGKREYCFTRTDLNTLIVKALNEAIPLAEAKRINLETDLKQLPPVPLDAVRILQVLRNLIGNALKFTPGCGRVSISSLCSGHRVQVRISDTGPGIPIEHRAVLFDKYRQASATGPHRIHGTGLGLAIVKNIVRDHGGEVWVESEEGRGSTFTFFLPISS
jgi:two-component system sensor histidine kinase GlrK